MRKWSLRDWVYVAVFGALWGAVEITLGAYLHLIFPPLTNTFLNGLTLGSLAWPSPSSGGDSCRARERC